MRARQFWLGACFGFNVCGLALAVSKRDYAAAVLIGGGLLSVTLWSVES